eukprot:1129509-Prymnesium_polylepis.3
MRSGKPSPPRSRATNEVSREGAGAPPWNWGPAISRMRGPSGRPFRAATVELLGCDCCVAPSSKTVRAAHNSNDMHRGNCINIESHVPVAFPLLS